MRRGDETVLTRSMSKSSKSGLMKCFSKIETSTLGLLQLGLPCHMTSLFQQPVGVTLSLVTVSRDWDAVDLVNVMRVRPECERASDLRRCTLSKICPPTQRMIASPARLEQ